MNRKFKVALIGCGVISDNHISALTSIDNVEIVAIADIDTAKPEAKIKKYGLNCRIYSDYIEMLDKEEPNAVHVLTPHYLHTEMTIEALSRDINVFLEKPLCIKREDVEKIINAEKQSKAKVCVSFQTRYNETVKLAKRIAEEDGGVKNAYATVVWNRNDNYYAQGEWRGKWETEGGGVMINQAIHTLDLLGIFLGIPKNVQAVCSKLRHSDAIEVEDSCECIIDYDSGKSAIVYATTNFQGYDSTMLHVETKNHTIEIREPNIYVDGHPLEIEKSDSYIGKKCYGSGHSMLIEDFYNSLEREKDVPVPVTQAQYAVRIILAAYKSNGKITSI